MSYQNNTYPLPSQPVRTIDIQSVMKMVYIWMGLGLLTTTIVALLSNSNPTLMDLRGNSAAVILAIVLEFALVIAISFGMNRHWLTPTLAASMFFLYSALTGFTLSIILIVFEIGAITNALATTVLLFGVMSVFGYTTAMDLTKWRTYLMIGIIGLVIAMVVNIFLGSSQIEFLISIVGVILFTALTAYDTQKIRQFSETYELQSDGNLTLKFSFYGALVLYLDFVNLFLFLLRLFGGGSRD